MAATPDAETAASSGRDVHRSALAFAAAVSGGHDDIGERARRVAERLAMGRLHLAVLGEFKRGKSTFLNALVGRPVLPTGVVPVTAVATFVVSGDPAVTITYLDGSTQPLGTQEDLADYVSEERNPGNVRQVREVEVRVPSALLSSGLVLVDTPGIGSVHRHNDQVAQSTLLEADGAIVVLSADSPLSDRERALLARVTERQGPTYFVLNKVDHLSADELGQVRRFVEEQVAESLGHPVALWCVASLRALQAKQVGVTPGAEAGEFAALESELARFVDEDLARERPVAARRELRNLAAELLERLDVIEAALALDESTLADRVERFRSAASEERRALSDDCAVMSRDVAALGQQIGDDLHRFAADASTRWDEQLDAAAARRPRRELEEVLSGAVEQAVEETFESFRRDHATRVDRLWHELAERRRRGVERRINELRQLATDLFDVRLPVVRVPEVAEEEQRFFYLFVRVGSQNEGLVRLARWMLPAHVARRRLAEHAKARLRREMDKHAGRAHFDLVQRLDATCKHFEADLRSELDRSVASVLQAAERAEELRRQTHEERTARLADDDVMRRLARSIVVHRVHDAHLPELA